MQQANNETVNVAVNSKVWKPAVYARLSDEDKDAKIKGMSQSIEHQIDILEGYVKQKGWQRPKVFYDDDRTGTNFNRKGFQDMYSAAERGDINVIVIKDTSRFGRNWVQSGMYFEQIEGMGVRFISIQESLDTADPKCPALKMLPFYFIFNEWHSQTTSEKIKTVFQKQAEKGIFRAKKAPYGYLKDPLNKHKLIIDPDAAEIVKRIFSLRLEKRSCRSIAMTLNADGILSPSDYNAVRLGIDNKDTHIGQWSCNTITSIFSNPVYCGDIVNNKSGSISYKNQTRKRRPKDEWITVENVHEPLISRNDWKKCNAIKENMGRIRSTKSNGISLLAGIMICADCKYKMSRGVRYYTVKSTGEKKELRNYQCETYIKKGKTACSSHHISEKEVVKMLLANIHQKAQEVICNEDAARERFCMLKTQSTGTQLKSDKEELKKIKKRLSVVDKLIRAAFEKSVLEDEDESIFTNCLHTYQEEKQAIQDKAERLQISIERQSRVVDDVEVFISLMKKYANITELDRASAVELIDRIVVSVSTMKPREIVIYYNFLGDGSE